MIHHSAFDFKELLRALRQGDAITGEAILALLIDNTRVGEVLNTVGLARFDVLAICASAESQSDIGRGLQDGVKRISGNLYTSLEAKGMTVPSDTNIVGKSTSLATELIQQSLDPAFAAEFEAKKERGERLDDPDSYAHAPVRDIAEYASAVLTALARYAPKREAEQLQRAAEAMLEAP